MPVAFIGKSDSGQEHPVDQPFGSATPHPTTSDAQGSASQHQRTLFPETSPDQAPSPDGSLSRRRGSDRTSSLKMQQPQPGTVSPVPSAAADARPAQCDVRVSIAIKHEERKAGRRLIDACACVTMNCRSGSGERKAPCNDPTARRPEWRSSACVSRRQVCLDAFLRPRPGFLPSRCAWPRRSAPRPDSRRKILPCTIRRRKAVALSGDGEESTIRFAIDHRDGESAKRLPDRNCRRMCLAPAIQRQGASAVFASAAYETKSAKGSSAAPSLVWVTTSRQHSP